MSFVFPKKVKIGAQVLTKRGWLSTIVENKHVFVGLDAANEYTYICKTRKDIGFIYAWLDYHAELEEQHAAMTEEELVNWRKNNAIYASTHGVSVKHKGILESIDILVLSKIRLYVGTSKFAEYAGQLKTGKINSVYGLISILYDDMVLDIEEMYSVLLLSEKEAELLLEYVNTLIPDKPLSRKDVTAVGKQAGYVYTVLDDGMLAYTSMTEYIADAIAWSMTEYMDNAIVWNKTNIKYHPKPNPIKNKERYRDAVEAALKDANWRSPHQKIVGNAIGPSGITALQKLDTSGLSWDEISEIVLSGQHAAITWLMSLIPELSGTILAGNEYTVKTLIGYIMIETVKGKYDLPNRLRYNITVDYSNGNIPIPSIDAAHIKALSASRAELLNKGLNAAALSNKHMDVYEFLYEYYKLQSK